MEIKASKWHGIYLYQIYSNWFLSNEAILVVLCCGAEFFAPFSGVWVIWPFESTLRGRGEQGGVWCWCSINCEGESGNMCVCVCVGLCRLWPSRAQSAVSSSQCLSFWKPPLLPADLFENWLNPYCKLPIDIHSTHNRLLNIW